MSEKELNNNLLTFLSSNDFNFQENIDLKTKNWIRFGGVAKYYVQPTTLLELELLVKWCQIENYRFEIVGSTSNCYFKNRYNPLLVVSTIKLNGFNNEGGDLNCECGYKIKRLAKYCINEGIAGFEGFIDLPGTIGGAVVNNSGCYGSLISNVVKSVTILSNGKKRVLLNSELQYSKRDSVLKRKGISGVILSVSFKGNRFENKTILQERAIRYTEYRKKKNEYAYPNLGSTISAIEYKFSITILFFFLKVLARLIYRDYYKGLEKRTAIFLSLQPTSKFRNYISPLGICNFLWKDEGAELAFNEYKKYLEKITKNYKFEIEIKDENRDTNIS